MHAREKFERLLYITSNRNVGKRYTSPIFDAEFRSLSAERLLPLDYIFELEPVPPLVEMYVIYEMIRLVVSELLFLRVNRSLRTTVLEAPAVSACVCAPWHVVACSVTVRYDERGNALCFSQSCFFSIQRSRFAFLFGALFAFDPKLAAWLFIFRLDCLFLLVDGIHGCQTSSQLSVCGDCSIGVFASARRNWDSGGFVFCF